MPPRIYVRAQTDPQSAQLWWPGLGAARLAGPGGTDRRTDGRTAASLNTPSPRRGHKNSARMSTPSRLQSDFSVTASAALVRRPAIVADIRVQLNDTHQLVGTELSLFTTHSPDVAPIERTIDALLQATSAELRPNWA